MQKMGLEILEVEESEKFVVAKKKDFRKFQRDQQGFTEHALAILYYKCQAVMMKIVVEPFEESLMFPLFKSEN